MLSFDRFIQLFPEVKPPFTLSEDEVHTFSQNNIPLPSKLIEDHLLPYEGDYDEMTEFVACMRIPNLKDFHAIIYWKAELLNYQYILATFTMGGKLIDRRVLAGTVSDGNNIVRSVAQVDEDMSITILSGLLGGKEEHYKAATSTTLELELLPDGKVLELV